MVALERLVIVSSLIFCFAMFKSTSCSESGVPIDRDIMKELTDKCIAVYSLTCFKLDLLTLMERPDSTNNDKISPEVYFEQNQPKSIDSKEELPRQLVIDLVKNNFTNATSLDLQLFNTFSDFILNLNLSFPLVKSYFLEKTTNLLELITDYGRMESASRGLRKIKPRWIKWMASIIYAVGYGLLAGLISKSLLLSTLALGLTLITRFFPGGFGAGYTPARNNYEIVAHPMPQIQHVNTHSSEVKYEEDHSQSSSHPGIAYVYPRTMPHVEKVLAFHHLANLHKNLYPDIAGDAVAYKGYIKETAGK